MFFGQNNVLNISIGNIVEVCGTTGTGCSVVWNENLCFLVEVPDRTTITLTVEIVAHILPGTNIVSDGWTAYAHIPNVHNGMRTRSEIVHQANFVDPNDNEVHTQIIEDLWMRAKRAKRKLKRQFGASQALFPSYLHEYQDEAGTYLWDILNRNC